MSRDRTDAEMEAKRRIKDFAANQNYGVPFCPRCGRDAIKERLYTNAWSRYADVYICDACGTDEALLDLHGRPLPLTEWALLKMKEAEA